MAKLGMHVKYIRDGITVEGIVVANNGQHNKVYVTDGDTIASPKWDVYPNDKIEEVSNLAILSEYNKCDLYAGFLYNKKMEKIFRQLPYRQRLDGWNVCVPMILLECIQSVIEPVDIVGKDGKRYG